MREKFPNNKIEEYSIKEGRKYIKIIQGGRRVFCFIDKTNGNVLKAASWKHPEVKNPRGNLFSEQNGMEAITQEMSPGYIIHPHIRYLK